MTIDEKYKYVNQGYSMELFLPPEFKNAVYTKLQEFAKSSKNPERWQAITKGYEMALARSQEKKTNERVAELKNVKSKRRKTGPSRSR